MYSLALWVDGGFVGIIAHYRHAKYSVNCHNSLAVINAFKEQVNAEFYFVFKQFEFRKYYYCN